jgi:hypothetical protein
VVDDRYLQQGDGKLRDLYAIEYSHETQLVIYLQPHVFAKDRVMEMQVKSFFFIRHFISS